VKRKLLKIVSPSHKLNLFYQDINVLFMAWNTVNIGFIVYILNKDMSHFSLKDKNANHFMNNMLKIQDFNLFHMLMHILGNIILNQQVSFLICFTYFSLVSNLIFLDFILLALFFNPIFLHFQLSINGWFLTKLL